MKPQVPVADGRRLKDAPVAECIFSDVPFPQTGKLFFHALQDSCGFSFLHKALSQKMKQQILPAHAPDSRINGPGGHGSFRKYGICLNPMEQKPFQLFHICLIAGKPAGNKKFIHVLVTVQHENPFRIPVGASVPYHFLKGKWFTAGLHIPSVLKRKCMRHQPVCLRQNFLRLLPAVSGDMGAHTFLFIPGLVGLCSLSYMYIPFIMHR